MATPNLTLFAASAAHLLAHLRALHITVPLVTEGRRKEHREQYMMARFLATAAKTDKIKFPLNLVHGDRPDFVLGFGGSEVGIECVEAVPEELYEIEILHETQYPEALNSGQKFYPGESAFTWNEKHLIASGNISAHPWMPKAARQNWIAAMVHCINGKTEKLRQDNYSSQATMWLLIQDEWPTSIRFYSAQLCEAAFECANFLIPLFVAPCFQAIFIASGSHLICYENGQVNVCEICDLWQ